MSLLKATPKSLSSFEHQQICAIAGKLDLVILEGNSASPYRTPTTEKRHHHNTVLAKTVIFIALRACWQNLRQSLLKYAWLHVEARNEPNTRARTHRQMSRGETGDVHVPQASASTSVARVLAFFWEARHRHGATDLVLLRLTILYIAA